MFTNHQSNPTTDVQTDSTGALQMELTDLLIEEGRSRNDVRLTALARKYRMGRVIDAICRSDFSRSTALVEAVARQFDVSPSTLWGHRAVAIQFDEAELLPLLTRRTCRGKAISFTHLKVLSRVRIDDVRRQFLEDVYADDLSSEQLRRRIIAWESSDRPWAAALTAAAATPGLLPEQLARLQDVLQSCLAAAGSCPRPTPADQAV